MILNLPNLSLHLSSFWFRSSNFKDYQTSLKKTQEKRPPPFPRHCEEGLSISLRLLLMLPQKKILVARVFSLQRQVIYQIKAKRLNYLIKDFISSNFKRRLSFLLSNSEVSSLLLKLQPFRVVKYSLPFYCIWLTDKTPRKGCEEICIRFVLAELLHFKLKSRISSAIYAKKLT